MKKGIKTLALWLIIGVIVIVVLSSIMENSSSKMTYSELITSIENKEVENIKISADGNLATVKLKNSKTEKEVNVPSLDSFMSYTEEYLKTGEFTLEEEKESIWITVLSLITPFGLLIIFFIFWFMMMSGGNQGGAKNMTFGKSKARLVNAGEKNRVTFDDVAGVDEEKEELQEIVEFLKNPKKFTDMGARIPKGVLLVGQPGTGKTLLAKAVAGEAGVPFYIISGSDFVEMFVGVGASRVRDLFEQAKKNAPCIIFIDEIDAVGRARGAGLGGGHDEREQTLNQMLVEMDGFENKDGIIVLAATNRPDVLDQALLRPGRFDRQVTVSLPDIKEREAILKVHAQKVPLADDVDLSHMAKVTSGMSGADLSSIVNEAALFAAGKNKSKVDNGDLEAARDKLLMGVPRASMVISEKEKTMTAYHEAGHALPYYYLENATPLHKVSVIPRGRALGVTVGVPETDTYAHTRSWILDQLVIFFGGYAAETVVYQDTTTGTQNDIQRATELARKMVCQWGMDVNIGAVSYGQEDEPIFMGRELNRHKTYSEEMARKIDEAVEKILRTAKERALSILENHRDQLDALAKALMEKETLCDAEIRELLGFSPRKEEVPAQ